MHPMSERRLRLHSARRPERPAPWRRPGIIAWLALLLILCPGIVVADEDRQLLERLRSGSHTLYFRHVATDWSNDDQVNQAGDWTSCDDQRMRQLSDEGRAEARRIGDAIRALCIPVGQVLASPYCRTMETASLLGLGEVVPSVDVMNLRAAAYFGGRDAIVASARRLLSTVPPEGGNRVVVAHGNVAREATPVYPAEGEAVVFVASDGPGFDVVARIPPARWQRLLALADHTQCGSDRR